MLTLFAVPKSFRGLVEVIQRNAIASWTMLKPRPQIVLFGDDQGVADVAVDCGTEYVPNIQRNEFGTPLLNNVFEQIQSLAAHDLIAYVNADIILLNDFSSAIERIPLKKFLMSGRRWNLDIVDQLDFSSARTPEWLRERVATQGRLYPAWGMDYFVFPREVCWRLPSFAVGRPGWDNWLVYRARQMRIPVVDATRVVTAVHQNHDYEHVASKRSESWDGPEADRNRKLAGLVHIFDISDSTHLLTTTGIERISGYRVFLRGIRAEAALLRVTRPILRLTTRALRKAGRLWRGSFESSTSGEH